MASLLSSPGLGCVVIFPPRHSVHCTPLPAFDWKKKEEGKEKKGRKGRKRGEGKKDTPNTGTVSSALCPDNGPLLGMVQATLPKSFR